MMVNQEELKTHFAGDEELILELVDVFNETYPDVLSSIKSAARDGDFKNLELHAHTLKGMIANFFASELKDAAFELEKMGREQKLGDSGPHIIKLESGLPALVGELKTLRW